MSVAALALAYQAWHAAVQNGATIDFVPVWQAARALAHGRSMYAHNPTFVYLPTTAVVYLPFAAANWATAAHAALALYVAAVAAAFALAVSPVPTEWRALAAAVAIAFAMKMDVLRDSIWLGNTSFLLAPLAVFTLLSFERGSWWWGCSALAVSVAIKPLLVVLYLLPLLRWKWRELLGTVGPLAIVVVGLALAVPGGGHFVDALRHDVDGTALQGVNLVTYNVSLEGVGKRIGAGGLFLAARGLMIAIALSCIVLWLRRRRAGDLGQTAALGTVLLITNMFAGKLAEVHYVPVVLACALLAVTLTPGWCAKLTLAPALILAFIPAPYVGYGNTAAEQQVRWLLVAVLVFASSVLVATGATDVPGRRFLPSFAPRWEGRRDLG